MKQKAWTRFFCGTVMTAFPVIFPGVLVAKDTVSVEERPEPIVLEDPFIPDSVKQRLKREDEEHSRLERLLFLGNRIRNPEQIDTMRGMSEEDKAFLRRRYQILHPLE